MRFDRFTQKAQEAVMEAQSLASEYNHPSIEPEHLLLALLQQEGGVVPAVLARMGADAAMIQESLNQALAQEKALSARYTAQGQDAKLTLISGWPDYTSTHRIFVIAAFMGVAR